eukprot:TRINITY_DN7459_c0_g1_i3.p1 TRINITY_DN7459_c0_g1~~TRINITY_DN7459_c0_g1_i3.p1  ORF type:complete len:287 (+),score=61.43 TRINITY_DN7459_c0_g1_i3:1-861(+)
MGSKEKNIFAIDQNSKMSLFTRNSQKNLNNCLDNQQYLQDNSFDQINNQLKQIEDDKLQLLREISSFTNANTAPTLNENRENILMSEISTSFPKDEQDQSELHEKESHLYKKMSTFLLSQNPSIFLNEIDEFEAQREKKKNKKYKANSQTPFLRKKIQKEKNKQKVSKYKFDNELENQDLVQELLSDFALKFDDDSCLFNTNQSSSNILNFDQENELLSINNNQDLQNYNDLMNNVFFDDFEEKFKIIQCPQFDQGNDKLIELYNQISVIEKMLAETKKKLFSTEY